MMAWFEKSPQEDKKRRLIERYCYSIQHSYRRHGISSDEIRRTIDVVAISSAPDLISVANICARAAKERLNKLPKKLGDQIFSEVALRTLHVGGRRINIPLCNTQGVEWYAASSIFNFDFIAEEALGLLEDASVIYDFGSHHGVWSAFYSHVVGERGRVYSYEPSILNFEVSSLLLLLNGCENVVAFNCAIGPVPGDAKSQDGLLVDYVDANFDLQGLHMALCDPPDFIKIDIEGFEFDLLIDNPWLFDSSRNIHLELHVPHLERRGLDYRLITKWIDLNRFDVWRHQGVNQNKLESLEELSGYCTLLLKRKQ